VQFKSSNIEAFDFSNIFSFYLTLTVFIRKVLLCLFPTMGELCSADTISGWTQLSPTTFERPIDNLEGFLQFVGGAGQTSSDKQHWHTTTSVKVKTNRENFVDEVKTAWKAMRYNHPCYSAVIINNRWIYNVAEPQELDSWLEETFHVHHENKSARQLFPMNETSTNRAFLHVLPQSQELILHAPHTHVDAIGMVTFFDNMLQYLVDPKPFEFGLEGRNLLQPLSDLASIPRSNPSAKDAWGSHIQNFIAQFPTIRVKNENKGGMATRPTMQWLQFSEKETEDIVSRSRELGITVTAAAQAAVSLAARVHGQVTNTTHATLAIYDARGYIDNKIHPHRDLVGAYAIALPAVFPIVPDSFLETAQAAREVFLSLKQDDKLRQWHALYTEEFPKVLSAPMPPDFPNAADLLLSSAGILDKHVHNTYQSPKGDQPPIELQDLWIALEILSPDIGLEMWTFQGKLCMELIYNEAYHGAESVHLLLELIWDQLVQGLGINLAFRASSPGDETSTW
jgi:hypothetical protein